MKGEQPATILILGGTAESAALAEKWSKKPDIRVITSLAGRTKNPAPVAGELRIGGFGGAAGLAKYIADEKVDLLIDATHPFANRISANADKAAILAGIKIEKIIRPPWQRQPGDNWHSVTNLEQAASALPAGARAFLALGSQHLSVFETRDDVHFIVRMVDAPEKPPGMRSHVIISGMPGLNANAEKATFRKFALSHLVCRNSGGRRGYAKLEAARALSIKVIMVERLPHNEQ